MRFEHKNLSKSQFGYKNHRQKQKTICNHVVPTGMIPKCNLNVLVMPKIKKRQNLESMRSRTKTQKKKKVTVGEQQPKWDFLSS